MATLMANSAAAALLSLQMMGGTTKSNMGLKRRGVALCEDDDLDDPAARVLRLRSESPAVAATATGNQRGGGEESFSSPSSSSSSSKHEEQEELEQLRECVCDVLPDDVLAQCLALLDSFQDSASASRVCKRWRQGIRQAQASQAKLSFAGWRPDDSAIARLVNSSVALKELNLSNGRWGCRITNLGLFQIARAACCPSLVSISLWGVTAITDRGVVELVKKAQALQHFNVGGTFITDEAIQAIATHCRRLKCINLWCCRHVTETGLLTLAQGCLDLESINVWGMSISPSCRRRLKVLNPKLQLKPLVNYLPL